MKLLRYGAKGAERPGLLDASGKIRDLSGHVTDIAADALTPDSLQRLAALDPETLPLVDGVPQQDLRLGPCVGQVGKFLAIGLNYADHAAEAGMDLPSEPIIFTKWNSSIAGPDDDLTLPPGSVATDWEVELGIVIGAGGRDIPESEALVLRATASSTTSASATGNCGAAAHGTRARAMTGSALSVPGWLRPTRSAILRRCACGWIWTARVSRMARRRPWSSVPPSLSPIARASPRWRRATSSRPARHRASAWVRNRRNICAPARPCGLASTGWACKPNMSSPS